MITPPLFGANSFARPAAHTAPRLCAAAAFTPPALSLYRHYFQVASWPELRRCRPACGFRQPRLSAYLAFGQLMPIAITIDTTAFISRHIDARYR